jgi:hypothetical protein
VPLASSSTTGATTVGPSVSALPLAVTVVSSHSVAKLLATTATRVAAHAPQAKAKPRLRQGVGSTLSIQRNAATSRGTGRTDSSRPMTKPSVPVCARTIARMVSPHRVSRIPMVTARRVRLCHHGARRGA